MSICLTHFMTLIDFPLYSLGSCVCPLHLAHRAHPSGHTDCPPGPQSEHKPARQINMWIHVFITEFPPGVCIPSCTSQPDVNIQNICSAERELGHMVQAQSLEARYQRNHKACGGEYLLQTSSGCFTHVQTGSTEDLYGQQIFQVGTQD